ncbi:MAG: hypothetical protein ABJG78_09950 [Cyclobacteriaceae bacterium]
MLEILYSRFKRGTEYLDKVEIKEKVEKVFKEDSWDDHGIEARNSWSQILLSKLAVDYDKSSEDDKKEFWIKVANDLDLDITIDTERSEIGFKKPQVDIDVNWILDRFDNLVPNHKNLGPKIQNFVNDDNLASILLTNAWESDSKKFLIQQYNELSRNEKLEFKQKLIAKYRLKDAVVIDVEDPKNQLMEKDMRKKIITFLVMYVVLLLISAVTLWILHQYFKLGSNNIQISIVYNIGQIIGGILGGMGVGAAGTAYTYQIFFK